MIKILTVVGARPQFIKASVVSRVLSAYDDVVEIIIHTGQHYDKNMSSLFFEELMIPVPGYNLGIGGGSHGEMTGRQVEAIEKILIEEKPDFLVVYGDTNSTLAGALAAVKLHIPIAHIESGLRSFNKVMPEEINRILVDHMADLLFAPNQRAVDNLIKEGISSSKIFNVGDVMYDVSVFYKSESRKPSFMKGDEKFILATIHRQENTSSRDKLSNIFLGFASSPLIIILPLHPMTKKKINEYKIEVPDNVVLTSPVGYLEMVWLESHAQVVITDSGGVQKEAYFYGKRCITLREETEWMELCESGWNILVGDSSVMISKALADYVDVSVLPKVDYGDGKSSKKICEIILNKIRRLH